MAHFLCLSKLIPLILILSVQVGSFCLAEVTYSYHFRGEKEIYSQTSVYRRNLDLILSTLRNQSSFTGFYNYTVGSAADKVYGLFLCRGDTKNQTCQECIVAASRKIVQNCTNQKEAIIYYEECMVRYSNRWIFSVEEERQYYISSCNLEMVPNEGLFQQKLANKMEELIGTACFGSSSAPPRYFAKGKETITGSGTSYNLSLLVQSTPDLTPSDCRKCLQVALDDTLNYCYRNRQGMIFMASCQMRYDADFKNPQPPPQSPPPDRSVSHDLDGEVTPSIAAIVVIFVILRLLKVNMD